MSADPPYLVPGTEVSAKYKGAFCEAKIKKCQKSVKCKVSPKDGGPQLSVADDAVHGNLKIGALVKVRQPDSGQIVDGSIVRIIDSSIYTVVFDDGDVATLKRTQICLKGDKHFMESDTLDRLPLTNPEHFSTPVNLLKKERRRRSGIITNLSSGTVSEESDFDDEVASTSRRSPRGGGGPRTALDIIGKVVSLELGDRKKWTPALVIKPSNHESDMKSKGLIMVKSFRDNKIFTVTEKQVKEFNRESIRSYSDEKLTKAAVEKALKYSSTKELPASWKKDEILGAQVLPTPPARSATEERVSDDESSSSSDDEEEEEKSDMFVAQLYKFMDDRSTPINKPAQLYNRDVNLSKLYRKVTKYGGFNKVSGSGKWKQVANKLGFSGISAGTEMKLLYRRYLVAFEDFRRKMGETHMFEGSRSQRQTAAGGRNVLPPRDRDSHHSGVVEQKAATVSKSAKDIKALVDKKAAAGLELAPKIKSEPVLEETPRRTPVRQSSRKEEKAKATESPTRRAAESPAVRSRPGAGKTNIKIEKAAKLNLDSKEEEKPAMTTRTSTPPVPTNKNISPNKTAMAKPTTSPTLKALAGKRSASPSQTNKGPLNKRPCSSPTPPSKPAAVKPSTSPAPPMKAPAVKRSNSPTPTTKTSAIKARDDTTDTKNDNDSLISEEENMTVNVEVDYPPGTKIKVRYGRARNVKIYDAKVTEVRLSDDRQLLYSVHYNGWNNRYDEVISGEQIVGTTGKCEKKKMDIFKDGFGPRSKKTKPSNQQAINSASSTGSRTPEPLPAAGRSSTSGLKIQASSSSCKVPKSAPAVVGGIPTAPPSNRTTRSSLPDTVALARPTRSKSTDSNLSTGLPTGRKSRHKRSSLADCEVKAPPANDPENDETTEEESNSGDVDLDKSVAIDTPVPSEVPEVKSEPAEKKEIKPPVERKAKPPTSSVPEQSPVSADKAPRRTGRRPSKHALVPPPPVVLPIVPEQAPPAPEQVSPDSSKKPAKKIESPTAPMSTEVRTRMFDVIDRVAGGDIAPESDLGIQSTPKETEESSAPLAKRKKIEREDSSGSVPCEEAFVKIEPLKHKRPAAGRTASPDAEVKSEDNKSKESVEEEDDETQNLQLPPLIGSSSKVTTSESESKTSRASSGVDDSELSYNSSDNESKSPAPPPTVTAKSEPQASNITMPESEISNLSLLSEQASLSHMDTGLLSRSGPRASTRRMMATKRSPRRKQSESEMVTAEDTVITSHDREVSQLTLASGDHHCISPAKLLKSAVPRAPRQPKYNFKIEEELAGIEEQDARIAYLMTKLSEIRTLYSDVKSNLSSIERKRKRVRQRNREHPSHHSFD